MDELMTISGVVVFSHDWTHQVALEHLYGKIKMTITDGTHLDKVLAFAIKENPSVMVLDIPLRNHVSFILMLRQHCPGMLIIITQDSFLFSDNIAAEYFGGIILKDYAALMDETPETLQANAAAIAATFQRSQSTQLPQWETVSVSAAVVTISRLLRLHFSALISSPRAEFVVMDWLAKGVDPIAVSRHLGCSSKVIYHYRLLAIKLLHVRHCARDFIASLTVTAGPVFYDLQQNKVHSSHKNVEGLTHRLVSNSAYESHKQKEPPRQDPISEVSMS